MSFLDWLLGAAPPEQERWCNSKMQRNPWSQLYVIRIVERKEGWVRYRYAGQVRLHAMTEEELNKYWAPLVGPPIPGEGS